VPMVTDPSSSASSSEENTAKDIIPDPPADLPANYGALEDHLQKLKITLQEIKEKDNHSKSEYCKLRMNIKTQFRVLRGCTVLEDGLSNITYLAKSDPWAMRLPYMQKLFFTHGEKKRRRVLEDVSLILGEPSFNCLEQLRNYMDNVMSEAAVQPHVIDVPPVEATVRAIAHPKNILTFLRSYLISPTHLKEATGDSYHHDLFDKSVLLTGKKTPWKLRMHVFLPETFTVAQEEIHSHRNHFVSSCLYGGLSQELWEEPHHLPQDLTPEAQPPITTLYKYIYDPTVTSDGTTRVFNVNYIGKVSLARVQEQAVMKGQTYYMHPSVLHSVNAIDGCTITLVWNSPLATDKSCFATQTPWESESFIRPKFTEEEMTKQLEMVLHLLTEADKK